MMSREVKTANKNMKHTQQHPSCHHNDGYYYYYCFIYTHLLHTEIEVIYSCLFLFGVFLRLYIETNKRKELADLQLLGISETQASRLLDGCAATRSALSDQLICAANSQQLEKCHHSRPGKGRLNVPARKHTF